MKWNWQRKDWPKFTFDPAQIVPLEEAFLRQSGMLQGTLKHLSEDDKTRLTVDLMSSEAINTSEIEGELLDRDSVQSSIQRNFGLDTSKRRIAPAEQGIAEMMVDLYRGFNARLSHSRMFAWHKMITSGRHDLHDIGRYRTSDEPMQVVSRSLHEPQVYFEAPPSGEMRTEMNRFIKWFNDSSPKGASSLPALTRAGLAHLYFESIHPFEDGNGRIGRALSEKALSQNLGQPTLLALSQTIQNTRKAYYRQLELHNKDLEITGWLKYFAQTILDAQENSQHLIDFLIAKTRFYDRFKPQLNERQAKVIARMFQEGPEGFEGGLSAKNYIATTNAPRPTATRDLMDLVEMEALTRTGERRYTRYWLNIGSAGHPNKD